jgi:putative DNA primase/helicase
MLMLQLRTSFLGRENTNLTNELLVELPGILNWALDGLDRLTSIGTFTVPESSAEAVLNLEDLASPVAAFVRDRCERGNEHEIPVKVLFKAWQSWCEDNGRNHSGTIQTFGRDLHAVIPSLRRVRPRDGDNREYHYQGVTLAQDNIGRDRGPVRTNNRPVHDGQRSDPLLPPVDHAPATPVDDRGAA